MSRIDNPFLSPFDNKWYFWLGAGITGPYDEYNEAHLAMSEEIERLRGSEKEDNKE